MLSHVKDLGIYYKNNRKKLKYFKQAGGMTKFVFWKNLCGYRVKN